MLSAYYILLTSRAIGANVLPKQFSTLNKSLNFLESQKTTIFTDFNCFKNLGYSYKLGPTFGGHKESCSMITNAFVISALMSYQKVSNDKKYDQLINNTINYVLDELVVDENVFALSIMAYNYALAGNIDQSIEMIQKLRNKKHYSDGFMEYWKLPSSDQSILTSSYLLLAFAELYEQTNDSYYLKTAFLTMNYLQPKQQQNENREAFIPLPASSFSLYSLAEIGKFLSHPGTNMTLTFETENVTNPYNNKVHITDSNAMDVQNVELPKLAKKVEIIPSGTGFAFAEVTFAIDESVERLSTNYCLSVTPYFESASRTRIKICASINYEISDEQIYYDEVQTTMEIYLSSGYVYIQTSDLLADGKIEVVKLKQSFY